MSNDVDSLSAADGYKQALLTCMDPRIDVNTLLEQLSNKWQGWKPGKDSTYVVRNAGGVATDDAVRSLVMVQRLAAAPELSFVLIAVVAHEATRDKPCAMTTMSDDAMNAQIEADSSVGMTPPFPLEFFKAADLGVKRSVKRLLATPFIRMDRKRVQGFVYNTETQQLRSVS